MDKTPPLFPRPNPPPKPAEGSGFFEGLMPPPPPPTLPPPIRHDMGSENGIWDYLMIPMALLACCLFAGVIAGMQHWDKHHAVSHSVCVGEKGNG